MSPRTGIRTVRDCVHPVARHRHGTVAAYTRDYCRCDPCTDAAMAYNATRRRAIAYGRWDVWREATGTIRRLNALTAAGYSEAELGTHAGTSKAQIHLVRRLAPVQGRVHHATEELIQGLYDRLAHVSPQGAYATRSRRYAETRGWAEPWRWEGIDMNDPAAEPLPLDVDSVDHYAISLAVDEGIRGVPLSRAERNLAVILMHRRGHNDSTIGDRLGMTAAGVFKVRVRTEGVAA